MIDRQTFKWQFFFSHSCSLNHVAVFWGENIFHYSMWEIQSFSITLNMHRFSDSISGLSVHQLAFPYNTSVWSYILPLHKGAHSLWMNWSHYITEKHLADAGPCVEPKSPSIQLYMLILLSQSGVYWIKQAESTHLSE